jgi:Rrf2 family transcriptional regulator, nitric oxide-sensitive transcriptional repressor
MQLNACTAAALRILAACAEDDEAPRTMPGMAETLAIGEALVVKACHHLMRAGYLAGTRGRGGGYRLARPAGAITLFEIVRLFETEDDLFPCRLSSDGPCRIAPVCRLRIVCAEAWAAYAAELTKTTIADIVETPIALPA